MKGTISKLRNSNSLDLRTEDFWIYARMEYFTPLIVTQVINHG